MHPSSKRKIRSTYLAGLFVLVCLTLCASALIINIAPTTQRLLVVIWFLAGASATIQTVLWLRSTKLLKRDQIERASAAKTKQLADMALFAGGFAHEARNSLNALRSRIALLRKRVADDEDLARRVDQVQEVGTTLEELVTDFLTFGRPTANELSPQSVRDLVEEILEFERFEFDQTNVRCECDIDSDAVVLVDQGKFKRAILNLVVNARQAMSEGGVLRITGRVHKKTVQLRVVDDGMGIPRETLKEIFDTYYTTKSEGTGLGLAIVRQTLEGFGGSIECESVEGRGTTMTITLPLADVKSSSRQTTRASTLSIVGEQS